MAQGGIVTVKDRVLRRIRDCIQTKLPDCKIKYDVVHRKIWYDCGLAVSIDITEPLMALYLYFADKEDREWRQKLWAEMGLPANLVEFGPNEKYRIIRD